MKPNELFILLFVTLFWLTVFLVRIKNRILKAVSSGLLCRDLDVFVSVNSPATPIQ